MEQDSRVEAGVDKRDRRARERRAEKMDAELGYSAAQLDRDVVAPDQIHTVIQTFRDRLFAKIYPGREVVPKTRAPGKPSGWPRRRPPARPLPTNSAGDWIRLPRPSASTSM